MVVNKRFFVMDASRLQYYKTREIELKCHKCGMKIVKGNKTLSKLSGANSAKNGKTKYYHESCWLDLFI